MMLQFNPVPYESFLENFLGAGEAGRHVTGLKSELIIRENFMVDYIVGWHFVVFQGPGSLVPNCIRFVIF